MGWGHGFAGGGGIQYTMVFLLNIIIFIEYVLPKLHQKYMHATKLGTTLLFAYKYTRCKARLKYCHCIPYSQ